jgi:predicted neutral ceramidase superfamily lipid hydrolase
LKRTKRLKCEKIHTSGRVGPPKIHFLKLLGVADGTFVVVYSTLVAFIKSTRLDRKKFIGIATNGASFMICVCEVLAARLKVKIPNLFLFIALLIIKPLQQPMQQRSFQSPKM